MILERDITATITDWLLLKGAWFFKVHGHGMQRRGVPDLVGCYKGKLFAIEVKKPGGKVSAQQAIEILAIKEAGGTAFVAWSVDDVMERLDG